MTVVSATITTELLAHADGRPIAYIDATAVAVFAYQRSDGTYVIDVCTRDDIGPGQLRMFLDAAPLLQVDTATNRTIRRRRTRARGSDAERGA